MSTSKYYHPESDFYTKRNLPVPSAVSHGLTEDEVESKLKPLSPTNWRQQGNELIADTEMGRLVQIIPIDMILTGTDKNNLPILQRIVC